MTIGNSGDRWVRWSYGHLLLLQPHVRLSGLWRVGDMYFIVCPDLATTMTREGTPLALWFERSCRAMTSPVRLVDAAPEGAEQIDGMRTADELAIGAGEPVTLRQLTLYLHLLLPRDFPNFVASDTPGAVILRFARTLEDADDTELRNAWGKLALPLPLSVETVPGLDPSVSDYRRKGTQGDIDLIPSRRLGSQLGALKEFADEDDSFWADSRIDLLASTKLISPSEALPSRFIPPGTNCLVNASTFPAANIRNYLTLYDTIFLVAPLQGSLSEQCSALGISLHELVKLVILGRVRLLLPQAIDRYDYKWLIEIAEAAPHHMIGSRRLAAATVLDTRRRWPLFYPPLGVADRHSILAAICQIVDTNTGRLRTFWTTLLDTLRNSWTNADVMLAERGAQATSVYGISSLVSSIYETAHGKDLQLEFWAAGASVEWASALGASVFPVTYREYDEEPLSRMVASFLSARAGSDIPTVDSNVFRVIDGVLSLDNDIPVIPFATDFRSGDISRLRSMVLDMAKWNQEPTMLQEAIDRFNANVRNVERRPAFVRSLRLEALVPAVATAFLTAATPVGTTIKTYGPLGVWIASAIFLALGEPAITRSATLSSVLDFVTGALTLTHSDAVLVARAKKEIKIIKG